MEFDKKQKTQKKKLPIGRPCYKLNQQTKGIVKEIQQSNNFEENIENAFIIVESVLQFPLHLKCISNTVKQIDRNSKLQFCFTNNCIIIYYSDVSIQNKCFLRINCQNILSYYFDQQHDFIKFDIPINHIQNTFNFYNRSSLKSEFRIFGPSKPVLRIDSYKSEKKKIQKITNTINLSLQPNIEDINESEIFLNQYDFQPFGGKDLDNNQTLINSENKQKVKRVDYQQLKTLVDKYQVNSLQFLKDDIPKEIARKPSQKQQQVISSETVGYHKQDQSEGCSYRNQLDKESTENNYQDKNAIIKETKEETKQISTTQHKMIDISSIQTLDRLQKLGLVLKNPKLFNDCFFVKYKPIKLYSFSLVNQDIRKFITEVQKDCQQIQIVRDLFIDNNQKKIYPNNNYYQDEDSKEFNDKIKDGSIRKSSKTKQDLMKLKQIILKAIIPGSGSQKKLEYSPAQLQSYKVYKQDDDLELTYNISSNILKQITSNNPNTVVSFIMLNNHSVILKMKDQTATFKFQLSNDS